MSMAQGDPRMARPAGRTVLGFPLVYWVIGVGGIIGFVLWRRGKGGGAGALVGAGSGAASPGVGAVPAAGYGSANAPGSGATDWASVISQLGQMNAAGAAGQGGSNLPPGSTQGVVTNPPQVLYGAADPTHPVQGLLDELNHAPRWISKPGGATIIGGPVGYGAAGGEQVPNVYTTSEGKKYSELGGGAAFFSALASCRPVYWQPNPGTFVPYPTLPAGKGVTPAGADPGGCTRGPGSPPYGTPVFIEGG